MNKDEFQKPSGSGRKIFLVVVLLLVLGALGYDFLVAKPAYEGGMAQLQSLLDKKKDAEGELVFNDGKTVSVGDLDGDGKVTPDDVHKSMGREPSSTSSPQDNTFVEVYSWPRGIPFVTYEAYVIYSRSGESTELYKISEREPGKDDFRQKAETLEDRPPGLTRSTGGGVGEGPPDGAGNADDDKDGDSDDGAADDGDSNDDAADDGASDDAADDGASDDAADDGASDDAADDGASDDDAADDDSGSTDDGQ